MARIVINPSTFENDKDALCVAFDEAFRIIMEANGFEPQSEPTEAQRKFFSDTAYANDELMLRRTILARICTFDTSVKDPTDEQLQEAVEFLDTVMEIGAPQNEWEQNAVQRIRDVIASSVGKPGETSAPPSQGNSGTESQAAVKGGKTEEEEKPKVEDPKAQGNGGTEGQPSGQPQAEQNPNVNQQAPIPTDYRDTDGTWRTKTGQLIGNDDQKKDYDQAKTALAGTNSYYDNGVFRTQTGAKIGGDLASVQQYAKILNGEKGTGSYYDAGVWRTATGARLDISKYQDQPQAQANTNAAPAKAQAPAVQAPAAQPPAQTTVNQPVARTTPQGRKLTAAEEAFMANRDETRREGEQRRAIGDFKRGEIGASDDKVRTSANEGAVTETDDDADKYYVDPITGQRKKKNRI